MSLKQKTISGLKWSFVDNFVNQGIRFIIGIILARLLTPKEFGLIGITMIFVVISQSFIDSGFSLALIQKKNCTNEDYSTVFYFNLAISILFYFFIFLISSTVSTFFNEPQLTSLIKVLGIILLLDAIGLIQKTILVKKIDFKLQTKISIISSIVSGFMGIGMALCGWGVWSLVWKTVSQHFINTVLLWAWNKWRPGLVFSISVLQKMFGFGSKIFLSGLINTTFQNVYYFIIGKFFSAAELGYYTRADQFNKLPSENITFVIQRVSYPILSTIQNDEQKLKMGYKKLIKSTMFISFILMIGLSAIAQPFILILIGEKWMPSVPYLQLLCFAGMLYPLHSLNLNMLLVKGRSDLVLGLEVVKKILIVPVIIVGIFLGIKIMIIGMIVNSFIACFLNSYWSGNLINYPIKEQLVDIIPSFIIASVMGIVVYYAGTVLTFKPFITLFLQLSIGTIVALSLAEFSNLNAYTEIKKIILHGNNFKT
jgi:O-antigen/teichoic acid export membrane protein